MDLSFDGWGEDGISEVEHEQPLGVEDLIGLADSCARQLHGKQELLTLYASISAGEEVACSLDGSDCGPEMPQPVSQACRLQVPSPPLPDPAYRVKHLYRNYALQVYSGTHVQQASGIGRHCCIESQLGPSAQLALFVRCAC